jgi:succinoglycan biosynthesis protein ExoO
MPAYNTEAYITQAIQSALAQTFDRIEVIVINDCSTDRTGEIASRFTDQRVRVIHHERNCGITLSSNRAIAEAKGAWIAILDSDDWYAPERLERMLQVAQAENADVVIDDLYLIRDGETEPWSTLIQESGAAFQGPIQIDPVFFVQTDVYGKRRCLRLGLSKPLFRRSFLDRYQIRYDESLRVVQDFWIDMECLVHGARFILLPEPYYFYRSRPGSAVSSDRIAWLNDCCQATERFMQRSIVHQYPGLLPALAQRLQVFQQARAYYQVIQPWKQRQYAAAIQAMLTQPAFWQRLVTQLPGIVARRWQYHLLGNRSAYEMLPQPTVRKVQMTKNSESNLTNLQVSDCQSSDLKTSDLKTSDLKTSESRTSRSPLR